MNELDTGHRVSKSMSAIGVYIPRVSRVFILEAFRLTLFKRIRQK